MGIRFNYKIVLNSINNLFKLKKDYRRFIHLFWLFLWVLAFHRYLGTNDYHVYFKFWGSTFFIIPVIGFMIQIIYPTICGWMIQTLINSMYLFNYFSSYSKTFVYNYPVKWDLDQSVRSFQLVMIFISVYVVYVIFIIPGKEKKILNYLKTLFVKIL
jgi:hypothetical protein